MIAADRFQTTQAKEAVPLLNYICYVFNSCLRTLYGGFWVLLY